MSVDATPGGAGIRTGPFGEGRPLTPGVDISHRSAHARAASGLGRTFQAALLFPELTVREVVELALDSLGSAWYLTSDLRQTVLGPARSKASPRVLPSSVAGAWFDARSDAWLADRTSSGFFIAVPEAR